MSDYQPPPTYADVVLVDKDTGAAKFNPIWLDWFIRLVQNIGSTGAADHNTLNNLQGGSANQYYHLTLAAYTAASAYLHNALNGIQGGAVGEYYHFTTAEHTLLAAFLHNSLNTLQGGTSGEYYHFTSAEHTTLAAYLHNSLNTLQGGTSGQYYHLTSAQQAMVAAYVPPTSFTPTVTLVGGAGNTVPVYSTNAGRYSVMNGQCYVSIALDGDNGAEGAGTGTFTVALPVAIGSSEPQGQQILLGVGLNNATRYELASTLVSGATTIALAYFNTATSIAAFTGADQNNTSRGVRLKFFYEV